MGITFDDLQVQSDGERGGGNSRRRWVAGVGAAMLIAAAGGVGYGIGRSVDDGSSSAGSSEVDSTAARPGDDAPPTTAVAEPSIAADDAAVPVTTTLLGDVTAEMAGDMGASGGWAYSQWNGGPLETMFERTTDSGFTLRAQLGQVWEDEGYYGPGDWRPAPWCFPSGDLRISLAGNEVIDVGSAGWYREAYQGRAVSWLTMGSADDRPQWVVVVQAPPDTTAVTVTFADGSTDTTAPQNGVAVLTVPGSGPTEVTEGGYTYFVDTAPDFAVTFDEPAGAVTVESEGVDTWNDPEFVASCQPPPPALPEPGEQPEEAAAAEAEIVRAMTALYDSTDPIDGDAEYLDDATGVSEARAQIAEGAYKAEAASAQAIVEELVFVSPATAWFRYRVDTGGIGLANRYGNAVFVDGTWKITRDTVCQDLSMAGGDCGGGWTSVVPPSVQEGEVLMARPLAD